MKSFTDEVEALAYTKSVTSMAGSLPDGVPEEFLPKSITEQTYIRMTIPESDLRQKQGREQAGLSVFR